MKALAFVLFLLTLTACTEQFPVPTCSEFHPHTSLSSEETARVASAVAKWNAFAGEGTVRWNAIPSADTVCSVRRVEVASAEDAAAQRQAGGEYVGVWLPREGGIALAPARMRCGDRLGDCIEAVTMHELGHYLGLKHTDERSVMWDEDELVTDFTPADLAECRRVGMCVR